MDDTEGWSYVLGKFVQQVLQWLGNPKVVKTPRLDPVLTSCPRYTPVGYSPKFVIASKAINVLWREGMRTEDDELGRSASYRTVIREKLHETGLAVFQTRRYSGEQGVTVPELRATITCARFDVGD